MNKIEKVSNEIRKRREELGYYQEDVIEKLKKEAKEGKLVDKKILDVSFSLDVPIYAPDKSYGWKIFHFLCNLQQGKHIFFLLYFSFF